MRIKRPKMMFTIILAFVSAIVLVATVIYQEVEEDSENLHPNHLITLSERTSQYRQYKVIFTLRRLKIENLEKKTVSTIFNKKLPNNKAS